MGHASREAGGSFEKRVESYLLIAKQQLIVAWWIKQQPAVTRFGKPIAQTGADFVGCLCGSAIMFAIECKSAAERKSAKRIARDEFTEKQQAHLECVARAQGLALAAIEFRDEQSGEKHSFLVPWASMPWKTPRSSESVSREDIPAQFAIRHESPLNVYVQRCFRCSSYFPVGSRGSCCATGGAAF